MENPGQSRDIRRRGGAGLNREVYMKVCRGHLLPEPLGSEAGSKFSHPPSIGQLKRQVIAKIRENKEVYSMWS